MSIGHIGPDRPHYALLATILLSGSATWAVAAPQACSREKVDEILAMATVNALSAQVDCNLELSKGDVVTKRLSFRGAAASGTTLDCHGAALRKAPRLSDDLRLVVTSRQLKNNQWEPAENIIIRNCRIEGAVLIRGMAGNGQDKSLTESSRKPGHTERVQAAAPRDIVFERNEFIGQAGTPIYFAPGVHEISILNSKISGRTNSVAIYLDAESARNTIKGNQINTDTRRENELLAGTLSAVHFLGSKMGVSTDDVPNAYRELIAIDSSADNKIINNRFSNLDHGGIFLYRNCGEGGNIRQQTPHGNEIINNVFYYDEFDGRIPAIWLSSRNGNSSYCGLDKGYPIGSSISDLDYASGNFIAQNQFHKFPPGKIIRDNAGENFLEDNVTIQSPLKRQAGCYNKDGEPSKLLKDGEKVRSVTGQGTPSCEVRILACNDGDLRERSRPCGQEP